MTRETAATRTIALLATGDEISQGDILNSNSQEIALRLTSHGMQVRMHAAAPDSIHEIECALRFLLETHQAVIITGGLGPTSDDLTRYALSKVINQPLVFHEPTWDKIAARLHRFGYAKPPESNRQQALFPESATIIPNPNGTAAGCVVQLGEQFIFMLPGPPIECIPMVDDIVIEKLQQAHFQQLSFRKKWLLFGASEGKIAEELDAIAKPFACVTGYRLWYPYIEFKLHSSHEADFTKLITLTEKIIQPYLLGDGTERASVTLCKQLIHSNLRLGISDDATGGVLESTLQSPETHAHLNFSHANQENIQIEIHGLNAFWQNKIDATEITLEIIFLQNGKQQKITRAMPLHGKRIILFAVEFICYQISLYIQNNCN
jgi:nicotinamide-nucleotide amidase